jgi:DNA-binding CsgD family transcriptional regulator
VPLSADLVRQVESLCVQPLSVKALREQLLVLIRRRLAFDGYNFPLTDPVSRVATSPLADIPGLVWDRLPELIRTRYLTRQCRWDHVINCRLGATSLHVETDGHLDRSALWQGVQRELGVTDTAMTPLADRYGCWAVLDLWRFGGEFTARELRLLAELSPAMTEGVRRAVARTFTDADVPPEPIGPAVVLLGPDLRVRRQTEAAADALLRLNPPDEPMPPIPAAAYNIAAALVAIEHDVPLGPAWARMHMGAGRWVTARASRLGEDIAVSIEPSTPADRMDVYARACGLSERESQVLGLLGSGLDTKQIAAQLVVSEHTASDHVKAILAKTGARTRQVLLARSVGAP